MQEEKREVKHVLMEKLIHKVDIVTNFHYFLPILHDIVLVRFLRALCQMYAVFLDLYLMALVQVANGFLEYFLADAKHLVDVLWTGLVA